MLENNLYLTVTPKKYIKQIVVKLFSIYNCIKIKWSSQTIFHMHLDSKKKAFLVAKIEDYNLTKQKYFEYIQLYKNKKIKLN